MANNKFIRNIKIEADAQGALPKTIQLLRAGNWNTPWHGDFEISPEDINQFVANYQANIGLPEDSDGKIQVNYGHRSYDEAAGWLSNLRAEQVDGVMSLVGDVEWTQDASDAIAAGKWRYISPEFNPRALPWEDPEEEWRMVANVLTGAGLTNIPLFKKLKKVAASERPSEPTGSSKKPTKGERMTFKLEDLRGKEASQITADERAFLESHKADLTADELKALDIKATEEAPAPAPTKVEGDVKDQVTISASELEALKANASRGVEDAQKLEQKEASDFADARIRAGQVKSDEKEALTKILLASSGKQREAIEAFVAGLPENERLKADSREQGDAGSDAKTAAQKLDEAAKAIVKASADDGKEKSYGNAIAQARRDNKELADEYDQELRG